jgi:hypothetical protein
VVATALQVVWLMLLTPVAALSCRLTLITRMSMLSLRPLLPLLSAFAPAKTSVAVAGNTSGADAVKIMLKRATMHSDSASFWGKEICVVREEYFEQRNVALHEQLNLKALPL